MSSDSEPSPQRPGRLTRRQVAKTGAATALAAQLPLPRSALGAPGDVETYDDGSDAVPAGARGDLERVIVIGAGFAGLAAANALRNAGVEVVVLEARRRLGGRANTRDLGGVPVDSGASWIHDPIGNPMSRFAEQSGVSRTNADIELDVATMTAYDQVTAAPVPLPDLLDAFARAIRFDESLGDYAERLGPGSSIRDGARLFLADEGVQGYRKRLSEFAIRLFAEETENAFWHAISLPAAARYTSPYEGIGQGDFPVGGYEPIVSSMAAGADVRFGHRVRSISRDRRGVQVESIKRGGGQARRRSFRGSHVIVTVPLGVLKHGSIRFDPPLPAAKRAAIAAIGFGRFEKVSLLFDEPFWQQGGKTHIINVGERPPVAFSLTLDHQKLSGYPALTAIAAAKYARMIQAADRRQRTRIVRALLAEIFGRQIPPPRAVEATNWRRDRFSRGSYSFIATGHHERDLDTLAEPVGGRVLFAGEATNRGRYGYTDGAMSSGIREAKRLLRRPAVELRSS